MNIKVSKRNEPVAFEVIEHFGGKLIVMHGDDIELEMPPNWNYINDQNLFFHFYDEYNRERALFVGVNRLLYISMRFAISWVQKTGDPFASFYVDEKYILNGKVSRVRFYEEEVATNLLSERQIELFPLYVDDKSRYIAYWG